MDVVSTGRRRRWSVAEKFRIVEESLAGDASVSAAARRYDLMPQQLFAWRRLARDGVLGGTGEPGFVRAVVEPLAATPRPGGGRMEVVCANGRRIVVGPDVDAGALARVIGVLERR